jgi:hypothetical protein
MSRFLKKEKPTAPVGTMPWHTERRRAAFARICGQHARLGGIPITELCLSYSTTILLVLSVPKPDSTILFCQATYKSTVQSSL